MTTPQDPENEPTGNEPTKDEPDRADAVPDGRADGLAREQRDAQDPATTEEALWRAIIDNYGERPRIEEPGPGRPSAPRGIRAREEPPTRAAPEPGPVDPGDHFVPPQPPPLPTPPPARLLAWIGLFGVPVFVLFALVASLVVPPWMGLILMVWFVGGFVYLIASMGPGSGAGRDEGPNGGVGGGRPNDSGDGSDDGARL